MMKKTTTLQELRGRRSESGVLPLLPDLLNTTEVQLAW